MPQQSELILLGPHRLHSRADAHTIQKVDKKRKVQRNEYIVQKRQKQCPVACKEYNTSHRQKRHTLLLQACKHETRKGTECTTASTAKPPTDPTTFQTSFSSLYFFCAELADSGIHTLSLLPRSHRRWRGGAPALVSPLLPRPLRSLRRLHGPQRGFSTRVALGLVAVVRRFLDPPDGTFFSRRLAR
jgi:hypothetical protein